MKVNRPIRRKGQIAVIDCQPDLKMMFYVDPEDAEDTMDQMKRWGFVDVVQDINGDILCYREL